MISLPYKQEVTKDDFKEFTGYDLTKDNRIKVDDSGNVEETINRFFLEVAESVYNYLLSQTNSIDKTHIIINEYSSYIQIAQLHQAKYIYENGNSLALNGYSTSGVSMEIKDLRGSRAYSPTMINYLNASGLLYVGIF